GSRPRLCRRSRPPRRRRRAEGSRPVPARGRAPSARPRERSRTVSLAFSLEHHCGLSCSSPGDEFILMVVDAADPRVPRLTVAAGSGGMLAEHNTVCVLSVTELERESDTLTAHAVAHARGRPGRGDPPSPLRGAPPHLRAERDRLPSGRSRRGDAPELERAVRRPD